YFLDSNIIIYFIKGKFRNIGEMLEVHDKDIVIPSVVLAELEYGARNSNN
ncbi:MAG: PIN domain-containing protein, partial [Treponema sp.]